MRHSIEDVPLHNLEAEMSTLGAMILRPQAADEVLAVLDGSDFYTPANREIFDAIAHLVNAGTRVDLVTLKDRLQARGKLAEVGGEDYIIQVAESTPSASGAPEYAAIVKSHSQRRRLDEASHEIKAAVRNPDLTTEDAIDRAESLVFAVAEAAASKGRTTRELAKEFVVAMDHLIETGEPTLGAQTGFHDFDRLTTGLYPGEVTIVAGRPSMGKTALVLKMAINISRKEPGNVAYFSLEMSDKQLARRMASMIALVNSNVLRRSDMNPETYRRLADAAELMYELPIWIDDTPAPTSLEIRAKCRRVKRESGLSVVIIDHLGLMQGPRRTTNRVDEISQITRDLKALAKDLDVPVIALSQLSRAVEQRDNKRPRLPDLRDSGSIEQDADVVAFVYRDDYYKARENPEECNHDPDRVEIAELLIAKNRDGAIGTVKLAFQPTYASFENLRL